MSDAYSPVAPHTPLPPLASAAHTEPPLPSSPHKRSVPDVAKSLKREKRSSGTPSSKLPPRPSTAGAEMISRSSSARPMSGVVVPPPLPPLPGSPLSPAAAGSRAHPHAADVFSSAPAVPPKGLDGEHDAVEGSPLRPSYSLPSEDHAEGSQSQPVPPPVRMAHSDSQYSSTTHQSHHMHMHWTLPRPLSHSHADTAPPPPPLAAGALSFGGTGGGGVGDTPVVVSPTGADGGSGHNWRRATRKLSLTAPMLGFGRKDRKGAPPPPPAYAR